MSCAVGDGFMAETFPNLEAEISRYAMRPNPVVARNDPTYIAQQQKIEQSIPERFEEIVRTYPDRLAVKMGARALTYTQLNQAANRIARAILEKCGSGSEPIALLFEHGIDVIATILGVLKAGKFYVPLDPSFPLERNSYMLEDSQTALIVTNNRNVELARTSINKSRALLNIEEIGKALSSDDLGLSIFSHDPSDLSYTSGSTGQPKGILKAHWNVLHIFTSDKGRAAISAEDRLTLLHSVVFGSGKGDLFTCLLNGACLFPFNVKVEGIHGLASWLREERPTVFHSTPAVFRQLLAGLSSHDLPSLRLIRLTGTSISRTDFDLYKDKFAKRALLEILLTSTETNAICSFVTDEAFVFPKHGAPVGYPIRGKRILLLDENGHEVTRGEIGEISVKSRYLSLGYWRRPDLTEARFLPDPDGGDERIYLTGDMGRMLPDGFLIHLGRKDFMVKIRGYRVEPGEIERALLSHSAVKDAGVVACDREPKEKYLAAYIVPRENPGPKVEELRNFLKNRLPDYMIPSTFMFMESLPLTNGKLDRKALPEPDGKRPELNTAYVAPRNETEQKLAQVWKEVLNVHPIGICDNFFDLGGHSLAASHLISKLGQEFHADFQVAALVMFPTIQELAKQIEGESAKNQQWSYLVPLQPGSGHKPVFFLPGGIGGDQEFFVYARLARHVGMQYPFYGLKPRSAEGREPSQASVEEIARDYLKEIRSFQPEGPYSIVGECAGGIIAYEIAQQLREHGQEIALLVLMDTPRPNAALELRRGFSRVLKPLQENYYVMRAGYHREQLRKVRGRDKLRYLLTKGSEALAELPQVQHSFVTVDPARELEYIQKSYSQTIYHYRPARYNDKITLFINEETYQSSPDLGWEGLAAGGIEVHKLPGNHTSYIRDNVQIAAKELRRCLENPAKRIRQQNSNTR